MPEAPDGWSDIVQLIELSRPSAVGTFAEPAAPPPAPRRSWRSALRFMLVVLLPTVLAGSYFNLIAADRYVAESRFVVRKPNAPSRTPGATLSIEEGPKGIGSDDSYAVQDYLLSRDAMHLVLDRAGLREALTRAGGDPLWTFPGPVNGHTDEDLFRLYKSLVTADYESSNGLTVLRVQAFDAEDARRIAATLLQGGEDLLNRLNERARGDAVRVAEAEVARSQDRARRAQEAVTAFRRRESVVDPVELAQTVLKTISALALEQVEAAAQLDMTQQASPNSPQIAPLRARVNALQRQIDRERNTLAGGDSSFAPRIAEYERLTLERDFGEKSFLSALSLLETARLDARRQQAYLERVVEPRAIDDVTYPRPILWTGLVFLGGLTVFVMFRPPSRMRRPALRYA